MADTVPVKRQIKRADGTVYTATRHVRAASATASSGSAIPAPASPAEDPSAAITGMLVKRGYSAGNVSFALDAARRRAGLDPASLTATKVMAALNDCIDALGEEEFSTAGSSTREAAERLVVASLNRIPANDRLLRMVMDPEVDFDQIMELVKTDGITDPVKVDVLLDGGAKALLDGAL